MRAGLSKVVKKGVEGVASIIPDRRRSEQKLEEYHRRGFFGNTSLEELQDGQDEPDPFPDMATIPSETVTKRWYNWEKKQWEKGLLTVKIMPVMFAEGGLRAAHFMVVVNPDGSFERCVAKRQKEGEQRHQEYETDVIMQAACRSIADAFNARKPVKLVEFVESYLIQRQDGAWWGVESYLKGKYIKHNNNWGYVTKHSRNTPQAFTHFSYEFTQGKMMIVDIQGVGDRYTDPQIHTLDGKGFGMGNMGEKGMDQFMKTHWCNSICAYLGLDFCAPKKLGFSLHHQPRREGTCAVGVMTEDVEDIKISDYVGELKPKKGSASREDLAMLGLSMQQFNALVTEFNELDKDKSGYLDKQELYHLFKKAQVATTKSKEAEEFVSFINRVESHVNAQGKISFKWFLLCWTDNQ